MFKMIKKILLLIFIFLLSLQVVTDTDFGWHLRTGEYIVNTKTVPKTDLFSFTNPDYPYVYHSWASEVTIYLSYKFLGFYGVTLLFATLLTICVLTLYKICRLTDQKETIPIFFLWLTPIAYSVAGGRTRVFGLLFLCLLYYLFSNFKKSGSRLIFLTPPLFTLWVNFHGSFILGIFTLIALITAELAESTKKKISQLILVLALSVSATLINPYFLNSWRQAITIAFNSYSIKTINLDWQPLINSNNSGWVFALLSICFFTTAIILKIKLGKPLKILFVVSFLLSLVSSRFAPMLLVFFTPIAAQAVIDLKRKIKRGILEAFPVKVSIYALCLVLLLLVLKNFLEINYAYKSPANYDQFLKTKSQNTNKYPPWDYQGSLFIQKNLKGKRVLTEANWGNFMLIYDKDLRLFYYGAMDNFIINGKSFALTYLKVVNAQKDFEDELAKYKVEVVFLPKNYPLVGTLKQKMAWLKLYEDDQASILIKN